MSGGVFCVERQTIMPDTKVAKGSAATTEAGGEDTDYNDDFDEEHSPARPTTAASPTSAKKQTSPQPPSGSSSSRKKSDGPLKDLSNKKAPKAAEDEDEDDADLGGQQVDLFKLCYKGDVAGFTKAIRRGADLWAKDAHGWSALHWAASRGRLDIVTALLAAVGGGDDGGGGSQSGTDDGGLFKDMLNAKDQLNGWTPLHVAAIRGHLEVIRHLLIAGASPSISDKHGDRAVDCLPLGGRRNELMKAWLQGDNKDYRRGGEHDDEEEEKGEGDEGKSNRDHKEKDEGDEEGR